MLKRIWGISICFIFIFAAIIIRLGWVTLVSGEQLKTMAEQQHSKSLAYYQYERGDFYDTLGRKITGIVENCLVVFPTMIQNEQFCAKKLAAILGQPETVILSRMQTAKEQNLAPFILKTGLKQYQVEAINKAGLNGITCLPMAVRYGQSFLAEHILGELIQDDTGRFVGASGLELQYDNYLRDRKDAKIIAYVDAGGSLTSANLYLDSKINPSYNIINLTINRDYQELAQSALEGFSGGCIIMDAFSGDILAAASAPAYDQYGWEKLSADDVYINKSFSAYPPASTFKIILTAAALELDKKPLPEQNSNHKDGFFCDGSYTLTDGYEVSCWNKKGHGYLNLQQSLDNSCNCYFIGLGLSLGGNVIKEYAAKFGLNKQIIKGYDYPDLSVVDFSSFIAGDVANASIGENGIRISPLQSAVMVSVCANGGKLVQPRLVKSVTDNNGQIIKQIPSSEPKAAIKAETAEKLKVMLKSAVDFGTGAKAKGKYVDAAGKTGTSENEGVWFCGFAPASDPRWAIAVYIENGVSGGNEAAGVFAELIDGLAVLEGIQ